MTGSLNVFINQITANDMAAGYSLAQILDGYRTARGSYTNNLGYQSNPGMSAAAPKIIEVTFIIPVSITSIAFVTLPNNIDFSAEPTPNTDTFTMYGVTSFGAKYGDALQDLIPTTSNNFVYRKISGLSQITNRLQFLMYASPDGLARLHELEIFGDYVAPAGGGAGGASRTGFGGFGRR